MNWLNSEFIKGLVSIIIPTYNRANLIGETIESIFQQDYKKIEIIIIDDGSTDNTKQVVDVYKLLAPEGISVNYVRQEKKGGSAARNLGAKYSTGEFIQFFDSDDLMYTDYISKRLNILKEKIEFNFCVCNCDFNDTSTNIKLPESRLDLKKQSLEGMLDEGLPIMTHSLIASRKVFSSLGAWNENILRGQDVEYFSRLFFQGLKGIWIPDILYMVRVHNDNLSQKWSSEICENMIISYICIQERASEHNQKTLRLKQSISRRITALCLSGLASGYIRVAWKYFWKGWLFLPFKVKIRRGGYFIFLSITKPFRKSEKYQIRSY